MTEGRKRQHLREDVAHGIAGACMARAQDAQQPQHLQQGETGGSCFAPLSSYVEFAWGRAQNSCNALHSTNRDLHRIWTPSSLASLHLYSTMAAGNVATRALDCRKGFVTPPTSCSGAKPAMSRLRRILASAGTCAR